MYYDLRFPFRISAEAGVAYDIETNESAEAYFEIKLERCKKQQITEEKYKKFHESQRLAIANMMGLKPEWITCISPEEYEANMDEEE